MKRAKYADISATHHFLPLGIEPSGVFGVEAKELQLEFDDQVIVSGDLSRKTIYSLQRISVAVQQDNVEMVLGTSSIPRNDFGIFTFKIAEEGKGFVFSFCVLLL